MRWVAFIGLFVFSMVGTAEPPCPTDAAGWQQWQAKEVTRVSDWNFAGTPLVEAAATFRRCKTAPKCTENFKRFVDAQFLASLKEHSLGAAVTDEKYYA